MTSLTGNRWCSPNISVKLSTLGHKQILFVKGFCPHAPVISKLK